MDNEELYLKFPTPIQNIAISLQGFIISKRRYDYRFQKVLNEIIAREGLTFEEIKQYQENRLRMNLEFALINSLFYQTYLSKHGIDITKNNLLEQIKSLPVLTKDVAKHNVDYIMPEFPKSELVPCHTSGTTGSGLIFYETRESEKERWATWWRYRQWHGINLKTWCGYFGGRSIVPLTQQKPPFWRINYFSRQVMFSAYHLSEDTARLYVEKLKKSQVPWIHGYPSVLALFASYILDQNLDFGNRIKIVTVGAESLLPHQKSLIERTFGTSVIQHYGQAEGVANISECEEGNLHVDEDYSIVEFVPLKNDTFKIIGTSLCNPAFFLLRYDTGDIVKLKEGSCKCGRNGRLVQEIDGRIEDYLVLPSGARIGRLDHIFKDCINIREAQIIQEGKEKIKFCIVKGDHYSLDDETQLLAEAKKRLGKDIIMQIDYVKEIPKTENGKLRLVVSHLKE